MNEELMKHYQKIVHDITDSWHDLGQEIDGHSLYHSLIQTTERQMIQRALTLSRGNQSKAAQILGVSRVTIKKKMADYDLYS